MGRGRDLIDVGHSFGGIPETSCTEGQMVPECAAGGRKGGIRAIVFRVVVSGGEEGRERHWVARHVPAVPGPWFGGREGELARARSEEVEEREYENSGPMLTRLF